MDAKQVAKTLIDRGISADDFCNFATTFGTQDNAFIQEIICHMIAFEVETTPNPPRQWNTQDANDLLDFLNSPTTTTPPRQWNTQHADDLLNFLNSPTTTTPPRQWNTQHADDLLDFLNSPTTTTPPSQWNTQHADDLLDFLNSPTTTTPPSQWNTQHADDLLDFLNSPTTTTPPRQWNTQDANDFLNFLNSSENNNVGRSMIQTGSGKSIDNRFECPTCLKPFKHKGSMNRHIKTIHHNTQIFCHKCSKPFTRRNNLRQHEIKCNGDISFQCSQCPEVHKSKRQLEFHRRMKHGERNPKQNLPSTENSRTTTYNCRLCNAEFEQLKHLQAHNTREHGTQNNRKNSYKCRRCTSQFSDRQALYAHNVQNHYHTGAGLHAEPFAEDQEPWVNEDGSIDEGMRDCYRTNRAIILERYREGTVESVYNIPLFNDISLSDMGDALQGIYDRQHNAFKLNMSFGFIMRHIETDRHRYFRPHDNSNIFDAPILISDRTDINNVLRRLKERDIMAEMRKERPDTKWKLVLLTNIRVKIYNTNFPLGVVDGELPEHIKLAKSIICLDKDPVTKSKFDDYLCLFRCLCLHKHGSLDSNRTHNLYNQWELDHNERKYRENTTQDQIQPISIFKGVQLHDLPEFEKIFRINVQVYSLQQDDTVEHIFKSTERYKSTLYVNQFQNHCSYIKNFQQYAKKFRCRLCDRIFDRHANFKRHSKICDKRTLFVYPGGFYQPQQTVFTQLEEFNITVPLHNRTFPWFAVFDFESMLLRLEEEATEKIEWTHRHKPISVSISSNVPDWTQPKCIINPNTDDLLKGMVGMLDDIHDTMIGWANEKWGYILEELQDSWKNLDEDDEEQRLERDRLKTMYGRFKGYITTLPVLGFNSAKYDLNLVKQKLPKHLKMHEQKHGFVVKKANAYACLNTDKFRFLDISHFLAPGTSYAGFLKAYQVQESKGFFPYSWLDDPAKLDWTELPPHQAFYNTLKETNISEQDYAYCQKVWVDQEMSSFRDFLEWYNNLDVGPFVTAVERLQRFYFDKNIDVLKTAMSVPGIARQLLFQSARQQNAELSIIDQKNADLHETIKDNIVGGPSIIFTRHHKANQTKIRGGKPCRKIVGYDANALYLWAIGQPMPEGMFVRRRVENGFKPEHRDRYMQAFNWLNYLNEYEGTSILHQRSNGREVRLDKYLVDGYDPNTKIVYEFQGCYHHGHQCYITKNITNEKWHKTRISLLDRTKAKVDVLRSKGFTVVEMWECEFQQYCNEHPEIEEIRKRCRPNFSQQHTGSITEFQIINGVRSGQLFGMVECDIEVPEQWSHEFTHISLPPSQYFQEMCPIFCNTDVEFGVIGEHMQAHARQHQLSEKPRRLLIGGMKARQILLATPLLRWYLNHGLNVTKIYQVVEYRQMSCFESFVQEVSDARRAGDTCKDKAIIADTMKLIGNSGYGSLIMDKTKHRRVYYVEGENKACFEVNKPQFRQTTCLDEEDQYYEIEAAKTKIKHDLPLQLGYFVLQYAKLRMLEFYYDFLDQYIHRSSFDFIEMDTDSAYMALSATRLRDIVKPEKIEEYQQNLTGLCDDRYNPIGQRWLPRECCDRHSKFDKRVPGLFKTEYEGDQMIGLCSKTYIVSSSSPSKTNSAVMTASRLVSKARKQRSKRVRCLSRISNEFKFSSKGVSKRLIKKPLDIFRKVLRTRQSVSGHNKGFRVRNNCVYTYNQTRCGFSYFYCKRRVLDDGIHTVPLDIILCPKNNNNKNK